MQPESMRIAIIHYHLQPGGVTEVIRRQSKVLHSQGIRHVILASGIADAGVPMQSIPGLGYSEAESEEEQESLFAKIRETAAQALGGMPDVWHFHNPTLGKNRLMPGLVLRLARENQRLVLQIHDLAEDGRWDNFRNIPHPEELHFTGPRIAHAFLNSHDLERFVRAGLCPERAFLVPNVVDDHSPAPPPSDGPARVFYPVRGIRRKNLGEILLLALLAPHGTRFAVSRAPQNPQWLATHDAWRAFAIAHDLPVEFDVSEQIRPEPGAKNTFESWIVHCTHLVTTSVAEGFGMAFIEPGQWQRALIGRALPELPHGSGRSLYESIRVEDVDFATLTEIKQREILTMLMENPAALQQVEIDGESATSWLQRMLASRTPRERVEMVGDDLRDIYQILLDTTDVGITFLDSLSLRQSGRMHHLTSPLKEHSKVVIFDIYGTLLAAAAGGVKPAPDADPLLRRILSEHGFQPPASPSTELHKAVLQHHAKSDAIHPEVDLRELWRQVLGQSDDMDLEELVIALESAWHPATLINGAEAMLKRLAADGWCFGLLSNAQCNTLDALGRIGGWFARDLTILSYQHGCAKPADELYVLLKEKLAARSIDLGNVWYIGNDPMQDIQPAAKHGFRTALFEGHPDSHRPGDCSPDLRIPHWDAFSLPHTHTNPPDADAPRESCGET